MSTVRAAWLLPFFLLSGLAGAQHGTAGQGDLPLPVFGYSDFSQQAKWDAAFLAIPDAKLAGEHLRILTAEPHWASSPEDYKTALYVAEKFKAAGLQTEIVPYRVWLNKPVSVLVEAFDEHGKKVMAGPTREHVGPEYGGDPFQDDPRVLPAFNGSSASGDVTAEAVYANYGTLADFKRLAELGISVKDKIVLVRYGGNFRGVKAYIAQQYGAKGVLIYSDPADDGYVRGDAYPRGPYRPPSAVQRGSVQFLPLYAGDPSSPGVAATPDLPDSKRAMDPGKMNQPSIPVNPLSYQDAAPILAALGGPASPREWQGGLPFTYHLGPGSVRVHMKLQQDYKLRTIWDVIGTIPGTDTAEGNNWVVAGNHRDAWVYGAIDPNSGTAAMLETVHGLGALLQAGWKPKRTIKVCSWDAEEEGLIGSTEWVEQHAEELAHAVAYFNTDVGVSGKNFNAAAVPSLKEFVRDVTRQAPSALGGTVYEQWKKTQSENSGRRSAASPISAASNAPAQDGGDVRVGELGSGSDYTPFFQHVGVPSTDIGSDGPYGVYHSVFDNFNWFKKNVENGFELEKQQAQVFGIEILHMADAEVLPYDYGLYGREVEGYLTAAQQRAETQKLNVHFDGANAAAKRFAASGTAVYGRQMSAASEDRAGLNRALRDAETALLSEQGLPHRPWFKHTIADPGEFTGYAAVVIPGVNEGIDAGDAQRTQAQLDVLAGALNRAAEVLEAAAK